MKIYDVLTEAPKKKKVATKKAANSYKPTVIADLDMQSAAVAAAQKIAMFAKKNCAPWLAATKNGSQYVYRGISDRGGLAFTKKTREDRRPKDTGKVRHDAFNAAITAAGGIANRSNSLFCTSSKGTAGEYGRIYVLLPVGKFNYTWGAEWEDWTAEAEIGDLQDLLVPKKIGPDVQKKIAELKKQVSVFKATLSKTAELDYTKRLASLTKELDQYKKMLAKEKAKSKNNQAYWALESYRSSVNDLTSSLKKLKTPAGKKKYLANRINMLLSDSPKSPEYKIQALIGDPGNRDAKDTLDPKNYDPKRAKEMILADRELGEALRAGMELMIKCDAGLYIKPSFYEGFVLPLLQGKKITQKYSDYQDDDDDEGYW